MNRRYIAVATLALIFVCRPTSSQEIHWEKPFDLNILYMRMAVDSAGVIYVVGDPNIPFRQGYRFNRSTDNGTTWSRSNTAWNPNWSPVNVLASDAPGSLYLGVDLGLSHSTDGGNSWSSIESTGWGITSFGVGRNGLLLTASTLFGTVGRSTDRGISWQFDTLGPDLAGINFAFADDGDILLSTNHGIYRSIDDGVSWNRSSDGIDASPAESPPWYYAPLVAAPWGDIYTAYNATIYRSTDNGKTWSELYDAATVATAILATTRGDLYVGSAPNGGVLRSTDRGQTWEQTAQDVMSGDPYALPVTVTQMFETRSGVIVAATDSAGLIRTTATTPAGVVATSNAELGATISAIVTPAPTASVITVQVALPRGGKLWSELVNSSGERVMMLDRGALPKGRHELQYDTRGLVEGLYFCRLVLDGVDVCTKSVMVVR